MNATSKRPERILVPTDFSPASDRALSLARTLAHRFDADLHVLHVREILDDPHLDGELVDEVERIFALGDAKVRETLEWQGNSEEDARFIGHVERGLRPADVIRDAVDTHRCDLVVMGTHGRRGLKHLLMGSVAEDVVRTSPVPVLTTRAEAAGSFPPRRILVAHDFSGPSMKAVEWVNSWASADSAEITLVHVVEPFAYPEAYGFGHPPNLFCDAVVRRCHRALERVAVERLPGLECETAVVRGPVSGSIRSYALENDQDLIVIATRGLSGIAHAVFGSVAESLVRCSAIPVLSVR